MTTAGSPGSGSRSRAVRRSDARACAAGQQAGIPWRRAESRRHRRTAGRVRLHRPALPAEQTEGRRREGTAGLTDGDDQRHHAGGLGRGGLLLRDQRRQRCGIADAEAGYRRDPGRDASVKAEASAVPLAKAPGHCGAPLTAFRPSDGLPEHDRGPARRSSQAGLPARSARTPQECSAAIRGWRGEACAPSRPPARRRLRPK